MGGDIGNESGSQGSWGSGSPGCGHQVCTRRFSLGKPRKTASTLGSTTRFSELMGLISACEVGVPTPLVRV